MSSTARSISPASPARPRRSSTPATTAGCCTISALKRGLIHVGEEVVNKAYDPTVPENGREQIEMAEQQLFRLAQEGEFEGGFRDFPAVLTSAITMVEAAYQKDSRVTGVPSGLIDLDEKLGGLQASDLLILAARPSMGKTALAVTIAANAAAAVAAGPEAEGLPGGRYAIGAVLARDVGRAAGDAPLVGPGRSRARTICAAASCAMPISSGWSRPVRTWRAARSTSTIRRRSRWPRCAPARGG